MKISKETLRILTNFASINASIYITQGNVLRTRSSEGDVIAIAEIPETFSHTFGIPDLPKFISLMNAHMSMSEDKQVELGFDTDGDDARTVTITGAGTTSSTTLYLASDREVDSKLVQLHEKNITPPAQAKRMLFDVTEEDISVMRTIAPKISRDLKEVHFTPDFDELTDTYSLKASVFNSTNPSQGRFERSFSDITAFVEDHGTEFDFVMSIDNLNFVKGDYVGEAYSINADRSFGFLKFSSLTLVEGDDTDYPITYYVTMANNSQYV